VLGHHLDDDAAVGRRRERLEEGHEVHDVVQHVVADHHVGGARRGCGGRPAAEHRAVRHTAGAGLGRERVEHVLLLVDTGEVARPFGERERRRTAAAADVEHAAGVGEQQLRGPAGRRVEGLGRGREEGDLVVPRVGGRPREDLRWDPAALLELGPPRGRRSPHDSRVCLLGSPIRP
jgi:hypothetical protein